MRLCLTSLFFSVIAFAQSPKPEFEVTSIRVAVKDGSVDVDVNDSLFRAHNLTLKLLVARAFQAANEEVFGGPDWSKQESFDIQAKIPAGLSEQQRREQIPLMLQALLAERFHLVAHREARQVSGYTLMIGKGGPKLEAASPDQEGSHMNSNRAQLKAQNADMDRFARFLAGRLEAPVANRTELKGGFNFTLRWSPDALAAKPDAPADAPPALPTAVQEQLGLKLESGKVLIPAIIIDTAQKPNAN